MINFFTVLLIAISLSMDTFSLSVIYGTLGVKQKVICLLSLIVGIFHFFMPLFGNIIGYGIIENLPIRASIIVGMVFIILSIQTFFSHQEIIELNSLFSFIIFGLTVSIDSFSVGVTISEITKNFFLSYFTFALVSFTFTYVGLNFGHFINNKLGKTANYLGAGILLALGLLYLLNI